MQRIKRDYLNRPFSGIHVQYAAPSGKVVQVARCLDPNIFVTPGYYAATCNGLELAHPIHKRRFSSAKACAAAIIKAGGCSYELKGAPLIVKHNPHLTFNR